MAYEFDYEKELMAMRQKQMEQEAAAAQAQANQAGSFGPPLSAIQQPVIASPQAPNSSWSMKDFKSKPGEVGYGMPVDRFMMSMGGIAQALNPNDWSGRLGAEMNRQGEGLYKQRMLEESPERRLAAAKTNQLLEMAQQPQYKANPSSFTLQDEPKDGPTLGNAERLNGGGFTATPYMTQLNKTLNNLGVSTPLGMAGAEAQYRTQAMTPGEKAKEQLDISQNELNNRLLAGTLDPKISMAANQAITSGVAANVAQGTEKTQIEQQQANLGLTNAQSGYLNTQTKYYPQVHIQVPLQTNATSNATQRRGQDMNERTRVSGMVLKSTEAVQTAVAHSQDQLNKILQNAMPKDRPQHYYAAGKANVDVGLGHLVTSQSGLGSMSPEDLTAVKQSSISAINTGFQNIVNGINTARPGDKTKMTMDLIDQIDRVRSVDPGLANEYENIFFGDNGMVAPYDSKTPKWKFWETGEQFDPTKVWQAYRSQGRPTGGKK